VRRVALLRRLALLLGLALSASTGASAAALDPGVQQRVRAATFEVVQKKPDDGAVTYDRPLPLELIPYQQRIDKYRSIGTAFSIGGNRYVTASHVFALGSGSQFGPPALRDAAGNVYDIAKVWKFSDREDFVEFSLSQEPKGVGKFEIGPPPALDDAVFAVGNALGEGVVIRDGVFTSETPEEEDGEWKWVRFSAAASPGNSGGPLIDQAGRVIGVVLRKSESENLNYALPIERVTGMREGEGRIAGRAPIRFPIFDASETLQVRESIALPQAPADFFESVRKVSTAKVEQGQHALLEHNHDRLFPNGPKSTQLLHTGLFAPFPRVVRESQDGLWGAGSEQTQTFQLDHNGFVEIYHGIVRLRRPDDVSLGVLYGDTKLYMDLLLKGYAVRRQVGSESVKVTSLGKAQWSSTHTDAYGRTWQVNVWAEPWADTVLVTMSLPTPEGYVALILPTGSGYRQATMDTQALMADYFFVSMGGTLWQWQEFLAQKNAAPRVFSEFKIAVDPDHRVEFHSHRAELIVTSDLVPLSRDTLLWLKFNFFKDGERVVWDVSGLAVEESSQKHNWAEFWRLSQPGPDLPESFQSHWHKLQQREFPFNGLVNSVNSGTRISATADAPSGDGAEAAIRYTLTVQREGEQSQDFMAPKLELLKRSFKALEQ
jgi:serine protease Do